MTKGIIHVNIVGHTNTGKTSLMKLFQGALAGANIETETVWGLDGEPTVKIDHDVLEKRLKIVAHKTRVILSEHHLRRSGNSRDIDSLDEVNIHVVYDNDKGYGVRLVLMGQQLEKWFGTFAASKERARGLATRLSTIMDIVVQDLIPREYEWVQPR